VKADLVGQWESEFEVPKMLLIEGKFDWDFVDWENWYP